VSLSIGEHSLLWSKTNDMRKQIMLVDDEAGVIALVSIILKRSGFAVAVANNAIEALEMVDRVTPDLFILDLMMPGIDGIELCRRLRGNQSTAHTPIIILSALYESNSIERAHNAGASLYMSKLALHRELVEKVSELIEKNGHMAG
jgi:DNA-binding response OmpR family regulator